MGEKEREQQKQEALKAIGSLGAFAAAVPAGSIFPFDNYLSNEKINVIEQQEAQRMFPGADPSLFNSLRDRGYKQNPTVPLNQSIALSRVFNRKMNDNDIYKGKKFYPEFLSSQPDAPSQELGSFQSLLQNKTPLLEGSLQAVTVTPGPGPSRFSADSLANVDKLGIALNQYEQEKKDWLNEVRQERPSDALLKQISTLKKEYVPQAGQVWGNLGKPQYSYATRQNPQTGEFLQTTNPSLYISRFEASPFKQADYLYTGDVESDPRVTLKAFESEGKTTGPSWGIRSESTRSGRADNDVNFRRDLIDARGELTTGDIQALLKAKKLPFEYQSRDLTKDSSRILSENLTRLAEAEGLTPYQAIEKYARAVPAIGEPFTQSTPAVTGIKSKFPAEGSLMSPSYVNKTDLRQLGILPPANKATYKAFDVDEFDKLFKYTHSRYNASNINELDTYSIPINPLDPFGEKEEAVSVLTIYRDKLRPQAANKLLNRTVQNLIEQSKPIQGLGFGGLATGAIATAMDPAVIDALSKGNYIQALTTGATNTAIGSAVGGATAKGLQALQAAGYARPAAAIGSALPLAGGVLSGLGAIETGKAINRLYRGQTGKDFPTRNQPVQPVPYTGPLPSIQPRMGKAVLNNKFIDVPYGSVAGTKTVGRPWWDVAGSKFEGLLNQLNAGSIIGR